MGINVPFCTARTSVGGKFRANARAAGAGCPVDTYIKTKFLTRKTWGNRGLYRLQTLSFVFVN